MSTDADMIRKVQGLLAKAEGTDNENEAETFFAKARELMLKHAIDDQMLRMASAERRAADSPILEDFMFSRSDSNAVGLAQLMNAAALACTVKMIIYPNRRGSNLNRPGNGSLVASQWCGLIGFKSDIEMAKVLYASLLIQARQFGHGDLKQAGIDRRHASKFMTGYLVGFAGRVSQRVKADRGIVDNSMALVVARETEVQRRLQGVLPRHPGAQDQLRRDGRTVRPDGRRPRGHRAPQDGARREAARKRKVRR